MAGIACINALTTTYVSVLVFKTNFTGEKEREKNLKVSISGKQQEKTTNFSSNNYTCIELW